MALVAFDLDNTLGFFYHIGIWGNFFSIETFESLFNKKLNPHASISSSLKEKLRKAEALFIKKLLKSPKLLKTILRPDLAKMIKPIIRAKALGRIKAICMYSNTWNPFSVHLAKELIETIYKCNGLFDCVVDATHPIRKADWLVESGEPLKTFGTLKRIFKELCHVTKTIHPEEIVFIDDRINKHDLKLYEKDGLRYIQPPAFAPRLTRTNHDDVLMLGMNVLIQTKLIEDLEYLRSDLFHRKVYFGMRHDVKIVKNIYDLLSISETTLRLEGL